MTITENVRSESAGIPNALTIEERNRVKNVKLRINPTTIPYGLFLLDGSLTDEARITGRIGRMHGERIVTTPARNANIINIIILFYVLNEFDCFAAVPLRYHIAFRIDLNKCMLICDVVLGSKLTLVVTCIVVTVIDPD